MIEYKVVVKLKWDFFDCEIKEYKCKSLESANTLKRILKDLRFNNVEIVATEIKPPEPEIYF